MELTPNNRRIFTATIWSGIFQVSSKLISPIVTIILARLILPEDFGIVTAITMLISLADIISDAGLAKVLVQLNYEDKEKQILSINAAFWLNFAISLIIWILFCLSRDFLASALGSPGIGLAICVAGMRLPLMSFSTIQSAVLVRDLQHKSLFYLKLPGLLVPIIITIPLAFIGFGFWSLILGSLFTSISDAFFLTKYSDWKPKLNLEMVSITRLVSLGKWSFFESIVLWFTTWFDGMVLISGLSVYFLGLYKTSQSLVNAVFTMFTAMIYSVLFSVLSRYQHHPAEFRAWFLKMQNILAYFVFLVGGLFYTYSVEISLLVLGDEWAESADIIRIWGLTSSFRIIFVSINSEVYRASGRFKTAFYLQLTDLIILIPTCVFGISKGFWWFVYVRSFVRLVLVVPNYILMKKYFKFSMDNYYTNLRKPILAVLLMTFSSSVINFNASGHVVSILNILISVILYLIIIFFLDRDKIEEIKYVFLKK